MKKSEMIERMLRVSMEIRKRRADITPEMHKELNEEINKFNPTEGLVPGILEDRMGDEISKCITFKREIYDRAGWDFGGYRNKPYLFKDFGIDILKAGNVCINFEYHFCLPLHNELGLLRDNPNREKEIDSAWDHYSKCKEVAKEDKKQANFGIILIFGTLILAIALFALAC